MPLDAICVSALSAELNNEISGMKIDRIQQPEKDVFIFQLRGPGKNSRLLVSAGSGSARVHITSLNRENPQTPPMFCMLLRKYLTGAKIVSVSQPEGERLVRLTLEAMDEMGSLVQRELYCEMLGRHANLVLTDENSRIIDCFRRVDASESEKRQLLPGLFYQLPPKPDKKDIFSCGMEDFLAQLSAAPKDTAADKWLVTAFCGISPLGAREIIYDACGTTDIILSVLPAEKLIASYELYRGKIKSGDFQPVMLYKDGAPFDIYCFPVKEYEGACKTESFSTFSELLDSFYTEKERLERMSQRAQTLTKTVKNLRDRTARKLAVQTEELKSAADREKLREYGDIIKANIYKMQRGDETLQAENFYSENAEEITIPLDCKLTPQQNAAKYYKQYSKAKNAEKNLLEQTQNAEAELDYFESVLDELKRADSEKDLADIRSELTETGYIRQQQTKQKKMKTPETKPLVFKSETGATIYCGRNNIQNDRLTLKDAMRGDVWLHTQKIHGSHVIISCAGEEPDETTLENAACIAAYYSQARGGSKIPVDYTRVKYVRKPSGAKPGMVIYTNYKTLYVTPDEAKINAMKK
jgi:predicted ribosome quality control (RQC) complex YloA/Tae2 family protein